MSDAVLRELERAATASGDPADGARLLLARQRQGTLTADRLRLAAYAGDEAALLALDCDHEDLDPDYAAAVRDGCDRSRIKLDAAGCVCLWGGKVRVAGDLDVGRWWEFLELGIAVFDDAGDRPAIDVLRAVAVAASAEAELACYRAPEPRDHPELEERDDPAPDPAWDRGTCEGMIAAARCWAACPCATHGDLWAIASSRPRASMDWSSLPDWLPRSSLMIDLDVALGSGQDPRRYILRGRSLAAASLRGARRSAQRAGAEAVARWALRRPT